MSTGNTSVYIHDRRSLAGIEVYGVGLIKSAPQNYTKCTLKRTYSLSKFLRRLYLPVSFMCLRLIVTKVIDNRNVR